jgi:hypothetical protein
LAISGAERRRSFHHRKRFGCQLRLTEAQNHLIAVEVSKTQMFNAMSLSRTILERPQNSFLNHYRPPAALAARPGDKAPDFSAARCVICKYSLGLLPYLGKRRAHEAESRKPTHSGGGSTVPQTPDCPDRSESFARATKPGRKLVARRLGLSHGAPGLADYCGPIVTVATPQRGPDGLRSQRLHRLIVHDRGCGLCLP